MDIEKAKRALINADAVGDTAAAKEIANYIKSQESAISLPEQPRPIEKTITGNLKESLQKRGEKIFEEYPQKTKEQGGGVLPILGQSYKTIGQGFGASGDILGAGLTAADKILLQVPSSMIKAGLSAAGQLPSNMRKDGKKLNMAEYASNVASNYAKFEQNNPELSEYINATGNIANAIPLGKMSPSKAMGKAIEQSANKKLTKELSKIIEPVFDKKAFEEARKYKRYFETARGKPAIKLSPKEIKAAELASNIDELKTGSAKKLYQKSDVIQGEAYKIRQGLMNNLKNYDNVKVKDDYLYNNLVKNIEDKLISDRLLTTKSGSTKEATDLAFESFLEALNKNPKTPAGLMQARTDFDEFIKTHQPNVFEEGKTTAFRKSKKIIRDELNNFVSDLVQDPKIKQDLYDTSSLLGAAENIDEKVYINAQKVLSSQKSVAQSIKELALPVISAGAAIGGASFFAPIPSLVAGGVALTGAGMYYGGKLLNKSQTRRILSEVLKKNADTMDFSGKQAINDYLATLSLDEQEQLKQPAKSVIFKKQKD